jgi:hypothetical protein
MHKQKGRLPRRSPFFLPSRRRPIKIDREQIWPDLLQDFFARWDAVTTQEICRIRYKVFYVCALALSIPWVAIGRAQSPHEARFAIEIPGQEGSAPTYALVNENSELSYTTFLYTLQKLANPTHEARQTSALGLESKVVGDEVFITATPSTGMSRP